MPGIYCAVWIYEDGRGILWTGHEVCPGRLTTPIVARFVPMSLIGTTTNASSLRLVMTNIDCSSRDQQNCPLLTGRDLLTINILFGPFDFSQMHCFQSADIADDRRKPIAPHMPAKGRSHRRRRSKLMTRLASCNFR